MAATSKRAHLLFTLSTDTENSSSLLLLLMLLRLLMLLLLLLLMLLMLMLLFTDAHAKRHEGKREARGGFGPVSKREGWPMWLGMILYVNYSFILCICAFSGINPQGCSLA